MTSHNSIHHLYHLFRFATSRGSKIGDIDSVVEWGGGYGNMAKLFRRMNEHVTYVILDTPLFSCLQWLYLGTVFGPEAVNLLEKTTDEIIPGKVNCVSIGLVPHVRISCNLFISTWALSESSRFSQDFVIERHWFDARHLLLAYQLAGERFPNAEQVGSLAREMGADIEEIKFIPGNYYAFL